MPTDVFLYGLFMSAAYLCDYRKCYFFLIQLLAYKCFSSASYFNPAIVDEHTCAAVLVAQPALILAQPLIRLCPSVSVLLQHCRQGTRRLSCCSSSFLVKAAGQTRFWPGRPAGRALPSCAHTQLRAGTAGRARQRLPPLLPSTPPPASRPPQPRLASPGAAQPRRQACPPRAALTRQTGRRHFASSRPASGGTARVWPREERGPASAACV